MKNFIGRIYREVARAERLAEAQQIEGRDVRSKLVQTLERTNTLWKNPEFRTSYDKLGMDMFALSYAKGHLPNLVHSPYMQSMLYLRAAIYKVKDIWKKRDLKDPTLLMGLTEIKNRIRELSGYQKELEAITKTTGHVQ